MALVWLPYADAAEAERRLGGMPAGIEVECYRADGDAMPTLSELAAANEGERGNQARPDPGFGDRHGSCIAQDRTAPQDRTHRLGPKCRG